MRKWASERIFNSIHGRNLVYNTCWEDPRLDREALQIGPDDHIAMITSAGCNALDYALDAPAAIHCVDVNPRQNALLELKLAAIRRLDYQDAFSMFGRGYWPGVMNEYTDLLRLDLSARSRLFWDKRIRWFANRRRSFFFRGTSGTFAKWMNVYIDRIAKVRPQVHQIFQLSSLDQQSDLFERELWPQIWRKTLRTAVSRDITLAMLGVPRPQRIQVEKNCEGGIAGFIEQCMRSVFAQRSLTDNYFWRAYLEGGYTPECCPDYLKPENFERLKNGLVDRIHPHTMTMQQFLDTSETQISRFVLLDHMDWLADHRPELLEGEWQSIMDRATSDARIIWRSGGLRTDFLNDVRVQIGGVKTELMKLLVLNEKLAATLHERDRVATYASFYIANMAA